MKIVIINGQNHKGSTYHAARMLADKLGGEITEYFLPRDFGDYCTGCAMCFSVDIAKCPHYEKQKDIRKSMYEADLIILASPVYVYHATAPMKNFLDHQAAKWLVHRAEGSMFTKQAVAISTTAGAGTKSALKDMTDSLFFWGIAKIYKYGTPVFACGWDGVSDKKKKEIDKKLDKLASRIRRNSKHPQPGLKTKAWFYAMRYVQTRHGWCEPDIRHWQETGWGGKIRPWKE